MPIVPDCVCVFACLSVCVCVWSSVPLALCVWSYVRLRVSCLTWRPIWIRLRMRLTMWNQLWVPTVNHSLNRSTKYRSYCLLTHSVIHCLFTYLFVHVWWEKIDCRVHQWKKFENRMMSSKNMEKFRVTFVLVSDNRSINWCSFIYKVVQQHFLGVVGTNYLASPTVKSERIWKICRYQANWLWEKNTPSHFPLHLTPQPVIHLWKIFCGHPCVSMLLFLGSAALD